MAKISRPAILLTYRPLNHDNPAHTLIRYELYDWRFQPATRCASLMDASHITLRMRLYLLDYLI